MESDLRSRPSARAGVIDVIRLGVKLGAGKLRGKRSDLAAEGTHWARGVIDRDHAADLDVGVPGKTAHWLVYSQGMSAQALKCR